MEPSDLRAYLLSLSPEVQDAFRGVLIRDRVIGKALAADTLEQASWPHLVEALIVRLELHAADGHPSPADRQGRLAMPAMFAAMLTRDRLRNGFTAGQVAWRIGVTPAAYREL